MHTFAGLIKNRPLPLAPFHGGFLLVNHTFLTAVSRFALQVHPLLHRGDIIYGVNRSTAIIPCFLRSLRTFFLADLNTDRVREFHYSPRLIIPEHRKLNIWNANDTLDHSQNLSWNDFYAARTFLHASE